jgi:hypothetical protein
MHPAPCLPRVQEEKVGVRALVDLLRDVQEEDQGNAHHVHPFTLIRFLRARQLDVQKAEVLFRGMLEWRTKENIDARLREWEAEYALQESPRARFVKYYKCTSVGPWRDLEGLPVIINRVGRGDPYGMAREAGFDVVLMLALSEIEQAFECGRVVSLARGKYICSFVNVIDLSQNKVNAHSTMIAWCTSDSLNASPLVIDCLSPSVDFK